jgi:PAS domain S-box-containing protein
MKVNTALASLLSGVALATSTSSAWRRRVRAACVISTMGLAAATLAEYLFGSALGIDEALFRDSSSSVGTTHAGRMSLLSAMDFVLWATGWLLSQRQSPSRWAQPPVLLVLLSSLVALCGYLYGVRGLYGIASFNHISPQTVVALAALCIGLLASRPSFGIVAQLERDDAGGSLVRHLMPAAIAVPILIGVVRLWGQHAGLYGTEMGLALFACSNVVVFVFLIYRAGGAVGRNDQKRRQAEEALQKVNEALEVRVLERTADLALANQSLQRQIAERTLVAEALRQGEERYRSLARNMPNAATLMFDHELRVVMAEGAILPSLAAGAHGWVGKTVREIAGPSNVDALEKVYRAALSGVTGTLDLPTSGRWFRLHTAPVHDDGGAVTHGLVFFYDMTAFAQTAAVLEESEGRLRGLSEAAFEGIMLADQARIIDANSALASMFACPQGALVGSPWAQLLAPSHRDAAVAHVRSGATEAHPSMGMRTDGVQFPIEVRARPIHRAGLDYEAIAIQDLSERRRAELDGQRSAEQFRRLVEALPQGITVVRDARYVYANPSAATILGFASPAAMVGESIWTILHPSEVRDRAPEPHLPPTAGPLGSKLVRCIKRDGSELLLDTISLAMDLEEGPAILSISRDVTREREVEAEARATATLWRAILDGAEHSIIAATPEGTIREFNPAAERLLGYPAAEVVGRVTPAIFHDVAEVQARARVLSDELGFVVEPGFEAFVAKTRLGRPDHHEWTYIRKDGGRVPVRLSVTALVGPGGQIDGFLGIASDITETKRTEAELIEARDAAERAMRARADFLARMSHEIRTPMNGILGMTELALQTPLTDEQRDYLETTEISAHTLLSLINDILDFSKIDSGKLRLEEISFQPESFLEGALRPLRVLCGHKELELRLEVSAEVPPQLRGDPQRIAQIVTNLVGNAIKFTERGDIVVVVRVASRQAGQVDLEIEVRDSGIGIPVDEQEAIFEAFSQVDEATTRHHGGTGLGLAICAQLAGLMGGKIWVKSVLGQGSQFFCRIALRTALPETTTEPRPNSVGVDAAGADASGDFVPEGTAPLRILIVDDNAINRKVVGAMLTKAGHRVVSAHDGLGAIASVEQEGFDVVLMDVEMPSMDGFAATRAIRATGNAIPIIALTAQAMKGDQELCLAAGMDAYLTKPIHRQTLLRTVARFALRRPVRGGAVGSRHVDALVVLPGPDDSTPAAFDENEMLERMAGDRALLVEVVRLFRLDAPQLIETLKRATAAGSGRDIAFTAHALVGMLLNMSARPASILARALEERGRANDLGDVPAELERLECEMGRLETSLGRLSPAPPARG